MTILEHQADNSGIAVPVVTIPDVTGLSPLDAAVAYADAGCYVLPVAIGKHPGSIVRTDWPELSTRDPDVIESYWDRHPDAGTAIHTGKSNLIAFDLDVNAIDDEMAWLKTGLIQSTRRGRTERGHYVFASTETFVSTDLKLIDGTTVVGDIRSGNTVIMAEPSPHPKADEGGQYRWVTTGVVPPLPDAARAYLRPLGTTRAGLAGTIEATDALVAEALADWIGEDRPKALDGPVNSIREARSATYATTRNALRFTASESRVGFYPLSTAVERIRSAMIESYNERGEPEKFSEYQFRRLVANGVGYAYSRSPKDIADEAGRDYGDKFTGFRPMFKPMFRPAFKRFFYRNLP